MVTRAKAKGGRENDRANTKAPIHSKAGLKSFLERASLLAEPLLAQMGLELVYAQCPVEGDRPVLRLFIDRQPEAQGAAESVSGVSLEDCASASRAVGAILEDDPEPQPDGYVLEVSSPGLNRPLLKEADFRRFAGRLAKVKIRQDGKAATYKGLLVSAADGSLAVQCDGTSVPFVFDQVLSARLSLDDIDFKPLRRQGPELEEA